MTEVGIRALQQNASAVVAQAAAAGETVVITDRGRPVAQLGPLPASRLDQLRAGGNARPPRRSPAALPPPGPGPALSEELVAARDAERY